MLVFEMIHLFSTFKVFSMVKRQSTAFCFKNFVIDSLPLMGGYKQISPFWLDNRDAHRAWT